MIAENSVVITILLVVMFAVCFGYALYVAWLDIKEQRDHDRHDDFLGYHE